MIQKRPESGKSTILSANDKLRISWLETKINSLSSELVAKCVHKKNECVFGCNFTNSNMATKFNLD